jgi:hypothetical protein
VQNSLPWKNASWNQGITATLLVPLPSSTFQCGILILDLEDFHVGGKTKWDVLKYSLFSFTNLFIFVILKKQL